MPREKTKTEVGSYFISNYPPFSQWTADELPRIEEAMHAPPGGAPLGIYLHIPFCRKRCKFCYFKVFTDRNAEEIDRYMAGLAHEVELVSRLPFFGGRPFRFVYFGGGTPSFLSSRQLNRLVDNLHRSIGWEQAEEVTFECEPGTLSEAKIKTLQAIGVTRLSLGVEHFDDAILRGNGRAHESAEIHRAWEWIQAAGFPNTNIDLIAGMVGDTDATWTACVRQAIAMQPDSVTIYQMELPFNTVYSKDILDGHIETPVADWPTKRRWVDEAFAAFEDAGYSVSSAYTLVRDPAKINFSYRDNLWQGSDLAATGIASFGHVGGVHYQNQPEWENYLGSVEADHLPLMRAMGISKEQALIREMILQLKRGWLEVGYFSHKFGVQIIDRWRPVWESYVDEGYATLEEGDNGFVRLSREGLLRVDALLPAFFEARFRDVRYT